jgi:oxygen-independent coproporphyrinogen-3 oxidase
MAGIYVHIPFCRKACHYCNFHFSTSVQLMNGFVEALLKEIELQKHYIAEPVSTVYFGGGTPSILSVADLRRILEKLHYTFTINPDAEITIEANPDDITSEKAQQWKMLGINRLSIGVQSFYEEDLQWMNRAHNAAQAINSIHTVQQAGFDNLTIDLIYGTPTLSDAHWQKNVQQAINLNISHLSCYALTVEPKTALDKMIKQNKIANVESDKQARHFELLMQWMNEAGYEHYEISNFARPGYRSKHNSSYWQSKPYLGLGPSAHSFNGHSRQWNVANNALYITSLEQNTLQFEVEELTPQQQLNEYIMTSLRTAEGLNLMKVRDEFGEESYTDLLSTARPYFNNKTLIQTGDHLILTAGGKLLADGIASDLFQL